ncbi:hypothetical protein FD31_GL000980 [Companilactobacillus nantensis DSM 16982]|uniref:Uncharacterized protein n=1 Tax=Companilactobacillus nantensis DSM 16982 TaxID=1423774 RepID=A0A0R1WKL6_9LACO|nr:hypothetical protein FD31_GL000980 [Companilactobacillus nantensis DSM 16982]
MRRHSAGSTITKREFEANAFAMAAMIKEHDYDLRNMTKYQICDYFGLDYFWSRFI